MKRGSIITISVIVSSVIMSLIVMTILDFDKADLSETIKNIASIATCLIASLGLISATYVREETRVERKKDQEKMVWDYWYKKLILDRHLDEITEFFDQCGGFVDELQTVNCRRLSITGEEYDGLVKEKVITPFTKKHSAINRSIYLDLLIIDSNIANDIKLQLEKLQDDFLSEIEYPSPNYDNIKSIIQTINKDIITIIFEHNKKGLVC